MRRITLVGFDADDTLWHNEQFFRLTEERFAALLADHADPDHLMDRLLAAERRNLGHYGFGIKGFMLSMIETAIEVTEDRVPARVIREIIEAGQEMLAHQIELLPLSTVSMPETKSEPDQTVSTNPDECQSNLKKNWVKFTENFITIRRRDGAVEALLSPQQEIFLRENLKTKLLQAQLAV